MTYFNVLSWSLHGETEIIIEKLNIVGDLSEIRREYLPNTSIFKLHIDVCRKNFHTCVYCYRQKKGQRNITLRVILNYVIHKRTYSVEQNP
jgi:hypothetical protein